MRIQLLLPVVLITYACKNNASPPSTISQYTDSTDFRKAIYFYDSTQRIDSAFFYFYEVTKNSKDSLLKATAYAFMAEIQQDADDFVGVQESAVAGIRLLRDTGIYERYCRASLYNNLGRSNVGLKNYKDAIKYYNEAVKIQTDKENQKIYRNNIAVAFRENGENKEALEYILSIEPDPTENGKDLARRMTNLASLKWKIDPTFNPLPDLHNALAIRIQEKDVPGITASYNHLSAYYQSKNTDSALHYAKKMYAIARKTNGPDDQLDALQKLLSLSHPDELKELAGIYIHLRDSVQKIQNAAKSQFAMIRYESETSKAENLRLQEENARKELRILRQRMLTYGSILLALLIVSLAIWRYRKKRKQTKLEAEAAIKESQLKISQRIHDTVANGLYRIMSEIEHVETIDKEPLLDKIEDLYEHSRDLSYESVKENETSLQIHQLITPFATPTTKISVVGDKEELWKGIPSVIVKELKQVIQELMVNMKKHSDARHVVLHFSRSGSHLEIAYKDDGRGFPPNFIKGNGLKSTGNRINQISGEIIFVTETAKGAEIKIIIPILSNDQESTNS